MVSIIIPCYNQGSLIIETLQSVYQQTFNDYEVIIVNDGSTDDYTNKILANIDFPKTRVLSSANQGLAAARNYGIGSAKGEIILPLDSDDKIHPKYIEKSITVMQGNPNLRIVYSKAELFDQKRGIWDVPEYSFNKMLTRNLIFASAFFYKVDWECVGGYNKNMRFGWEDWDFWLSLIEKGAQVFRISEVLFYYRIRKGSMAKRMSKEIQIEMRKQIFFNHQEMYVNNIGILFEELANLDRSFFQKVRDEGFGFLLKTLKNQISRRP